MPKCAFFQWPCDLAFFKIWLNTFCKIFLVLCTKLIFRCQKFVDELLISKGITLINITYMSQFFVLVPSSNVFDKLFCSCFAPNKVAVFFLTLQHLLVNSQRPMLVSTKEISTHTTVVGGWNSKTALGIVEFHSSLVAANPGQNSGQVTRSCNFSL